MSEYQRYEFQAIDRPLTAKEQATLRTFSSRATITSSCFAVDYSWGDFKGDAAKWMEEYFDAFLYVANWGTHELMLRLPLSVLPLEQAEQYCTGSSASARATGTHLVLSFSSEEEGCDAWIEEDDDTLATLLPLRAELGDGDFRALYLAWLAGAQAGELDENASEPPCPPGLRELSPALQALVEFLRIDEDLLAAAAEASPPLEAVDEVALVAWVKQLSEAEKTSALLRVMRGDEVYLRGELFRRFQASRLTASRAPRSRTLGALLATADAIREKRRLEEAERAAREKALRERAAAEARDRHLTALSHREAEAWKQVDALIATKLPKRYDEAVALLRDLYELCARAGRTDEAARRLSLLHALHEKKPSLVQRLQRAGLV